MTKEAEIYNVVETVYSMSGMEKTAQTHVKGRNFGTIRGKNKNISRSDL